MGDSKIPVTIINLLKITLTLQSFILFPSHHPLKGLLEVSKGWFVLANKDFLYSAGKKVSLHFPLNHNIFTVNSVQRQVNILIPVFLRLVGGHRRGHIAVIINYALLNAIIDRATSVTAHIH